MSAKVIILNTFDIDEDFLVVNYYEDNYPVFARIHVFNLKKWAKENNRLFQSRPVYEGDNVVDNDEVPISFDAYLDGLDTDEVLRFLKER